MRLLEAPGEAIVGGNQPITDNMNLESPAVLVIEDDLALRQAIMHKLADSNVLTLYAHDANSAIDQLREHPQIAVVWLDHTLPNGQTGIDVVTAIRTHPAWSRKEIVLISNISDPALFQTYRNLGVARYYSKVDHPIAEIVTEIKRLLER